MFIPQSNPLSIIHGHRYGSLWSCSSSEWNTPLVNICWWFVSMREWRSRRFINQTKLSTTSVLPQILVPNHKQCGRVWSFTSRPQNGKPSQSRVHHDICRLTASDSVDIRRVWGSRSIFEKIPWTGRTKLGVLQKRPNHPNSKRKQLQSRRTIQTWPFRFSKNN